MQNVGKMESNQRKNQFSRKKKLACTKKEYKFNVFVSHGSTAN